MPSILKRRYRQSLKLDQHSRQVLVSKLSVFTDAVINAGTFAPSGQTMLRPLSSGKQRARHRSHFPSRSPTTSRFFRTKSNASFHSQVPGAILPVELLLRIFHLGAELSDEFPVTVSQVCAHWRLMALWSPKLWRVIHPDGRRILCAKRILRSRGYPLHVKITIPPRAPTRTSALTNAHLRMGFALPAIKQWRSLSIRFDEYSPFLWNSALSGLCAEPSQLAPCAPELESISFIYPANDDTKEFHLFGDHAPKLRSVTLYGIRLRWSMPLFENLTYLDYTHHGFNKGHAAVQEVLAMLSISRPSLKTLVIRFPIARETGYSNVWYPHTYNSIGLRRIEILILRGEGHSIPPKELKMLVSKLLLPSLTTLELDTVDNSIAFSRKAVRSLVRPFWQHPRVERLIVRKAWNHPRCIAAFARSLPCLSVLAKEY